MFGKIDVLSGTYRGSGGIEKLRNLKLRILDVFFVCVRNLMVSGKELHKNRPQSARFAP